MMKANCRGIGAAGASQWAAKTHVPFRFCTLSPANMRRTRRLNEVSTLNAGGWGRHECLEIGPEEEATI